MPSTAECASGTCAAPGALGAGEIERGKCPRFLLRGQSRGARGDGAFAQRSSSREPEMPAIPRGLRAAPQARADYCESPSDSFGSGDADAGCSSPASMYVTSLARVSAMSRLRIVNWPMRSCGVNAESPFSIVRRPGW